LITNYQLAITYGNYGKPTSNNNAKLRQYRLLRISAMNISLTPEQESLIRAKIATGKYQSPQQLLEFAFRLLEEYEQAENEWVLSVREKIQAAIEMSEKEPPIDGEVFISGILERFKGE
jgi:antitoxin ParD1/3/4